MGAHGRKITFPLAMNGSWWGVPVWFVALAALGILLRVGILVQYLGSPFCAGLLLDAKMYWDWAGRIAQGAWIPEGVFHQGPLYPYLLGAFRALVPSLSPGAVAVAQLLLNWITCLLFLPLLTRLGRRDLGLVSASLAFFFSPAVFMSLKVLSVTLGLFLLQAGLLAVVPPGLASRRRLMVGGCLWGLACLASPVLLPAIPLLLLSLAVLGGTVGASARRAVPTLAGVLLVLAPVAVQNYLQDGSFVLISSNYGLTFSHGNNPQAIGDYTQLPGISGDIHHQEQDSTAEAEREEGRKLSSGQVARHYFRKGLSFAAEHPGRFLMLELKKLFLVAGGRDISLEYSLPRERRDFLRFLWFFPMGGTLVLMLSAVGLAGGKSSLRVLSSFLAISLAHGAACVVFYVGNRYAVPVAFFLIPAAALGLMSPWRERRAWLAGAAALVLIAALCTPRIIPNDLEEATYLGKLAMLYTETGELKKAAETFARPPLAIKTDYPGAFARLGRLLLEQKDPVSAVAAFKKAVTLDPANIQIRMGLAESYRVMGRLADALQELRTARDVNPTNVGTRILTAQIFLDMGDRTNAEKELRDALQIDPRSPGAHYYRSRILRNTGDRAGAMGELRRAIELDGTFSEAYNDLAVDEYFSGNYREARELAARAAELGGKFPDGFTEALQKALNDQRLPGSEGSLRPP